MRMNRIVGIALIAATLCGEAAFAAQTKTVVVVPCRARVVQFAMDIASLRPAYIVAYGPRNNPSDIAFYLWDAPAQEWKDISSEEFGKGTLFDASAQVLALVGTDKDFPAGFPTQPNWATKTERIGSLNPAEMANGLNAIMRFKPTEWQWISKRYGLTITDLNAERRRYGKYGPPGAKRGPKLPEASAEGIAVPLPPGTPAEQLKAVPVSPEPAEPKFDVPAPVAPAPASTAEAVTPPPAQPPSTNAVPPAKRPEDK